jgi:hypothetical protein
MEWATAEFSALGETTGFSGLFQGFAGPAPARQGRLWEQDQRIAVWPTLDDGHADRNPYGCHDCGNLDSFFLFLGQQLEYHPALSFVGGYID